MSELNDLQQSRLDFMQNNIRRMRSICEWSGNDLADLLGISRQSINNLETDKSKITPALFFALSVVLEEFCKKVPDSRALLDACVANFPQHELKDPAKASIGNLCSLWLLEYPNQFTMTKERTYGKNKPSSMQIMETIAANYKIFVCPDILLSNFGLSRIEDLCMLAKESGNRVNVPANAFKEIVNQMDNQTKEHIAQLQNDGSLIFRGDKNDPSLEKLLIEKFIFYKDKYNICLITNDTRLAHDVMLLNNITSLDKNTIVVINIDDRGYLNFCDPNLAQNLVTSKSIEEYQDFDNNFSKSIIDFKNVPEDNDSTQGWSEI